MPISKMYIGECQSWPHFDGEFVDFYETSCSTAQYSTALGQSPAGSPQCNAPYGNGWFSIRGDSYPYANRVTIVWNGQTIAHNMNVSNEGYVEDCDGYEYFLDYNRDTQVPADVLTKIRDDGWELNTCNPTANSAEIWAGCVKRHRKFWFPNLSNVSYPSGPAEDPSYSCGGVFGDGWFNRSGSHQINGTVVNVAGITIYRGPSIPFPGHVDFGGYRFSIGSPNAQEPCGTGGTTLYNMGKGWHDGCGYASNGDFGTAYNVELVGPTP